MISRRFAMAACGCCCVLAAGASASLAAAQGKTSAANDGGKGRRKSSARASANGERKDGSGFPDLHHIGLVVADRDRALAGIEGAFGFGRAHRFDLKSPTARVSSGVTGFNLRVGFVWMGNTLLEFLEPVDDRSPHAAWLRHRGEGMHHLGYLVRSIDHELDAIAAARGGARPPLLVQGDGSEPVRWVYLEPEVANGAVIELIERSPQAEKFFEQIYRATGGRMPA
jgi:methylmalonyl-CoA/ethylmalonyl-CoA epimerase